MEIVLRFYFHFKLFPNSDAQRERERERESLRLRITKHADEIAPQPQTRRWDCPVEIVQHKACCRLTGLVLLWVRSSPPLGRSRRPPLADLSHPLGQSHHWFAFFLWSLIFFFFFVVVVVVVVVWVVAFWWFLCCVVVGFVWIVVDFLWVLVCGWWWIFCGYWCVGGGGFCDIKFVWKLRKCEKFVGK